MFLKKAGIIFLSAVVLITASSCSGRSAVKHDNRQADAEFDEFCDDMFKAMIAGDSLNAHFTISNPEEYGISYTAEDMTFGSFSEEDTLASEAAIDEYIKALGEFDRDGLSDSQKITYDTLMWYLETQDAYDGLMYIQNVLGISSGIPVNLSTNFIEFVLYDEEDVEEYFSYMKSLDDYFGSFEKYLRKQADEGYFVTDRLVEYNIGVCSDFLESDGLPLTQSFEAKIKKLSLNEDTVKKYISTNKEYVEQYVMTFYENTAKLLEELKGSCRNTGGLSNYGEEGIRLYRAIVRNKTSSDMTVEEVIDYVDGKIEEVLEEVYDEIMKDFTVTDYLYTYQPEFDAPEDVLEHVISCMDKDFPAPATDKYSIEYMSSACEIEGVLAYYVNPRIDNLSVNNIKINGSTVGDDMYTLYTTLAHEGYPGHLYQTTSFFANEDIPAIRKALSFIGSSEGWAEYASEIAVSYLYELDELPENYGAIMINDSEYGYLIMARADLGINFEGWTKKELGEFLEDFDMNSDDIVDSLYHSCVSDAGSILPYAVGTQLMNDMKDRALEELGSDWLKKFNSLIIESGELPFPVYETLLDDWIGKNK